MSVGLTESQSQSISITTIYFTQALFSNGLYKLDLGPKVEQARSLSEVQLTQRTHPQSSTSELRAE